jgi:hypothetical protein
VFERLTTPQLRDWEHSTSNKGTLIELEHWIVDSIYAFKHSEEHRSESC